MGLVWKGQASLGKAVQVIPLHRHIHRVQMHTGAVVRERMSCHSILSRDEVASPRILLMPAMGSLQDRKLRELWEACDGVRQRLGLCVESSGSHCTSQAQ